MDEEASLMLNKLPVVVPSEPMFIEKRSPLAVADDPGVQSNVANEPSEPAPGAVREVAVLSTFNKVPEVKVLAAPVLMSTSFPVLIVEELK